MQDLSPTEIEAILKGIGQTPESLQESSENSPSSISRVQFSQLDENSTEKSAHNQDILREVKVKVDVILGRTKLSLQQLLDLKEGQHLPLNKFAGEPVEIEINGKTIAHGEIVSIDDYYGVHITQIL